MGSMTIESDLHLVADILVHGRLDGDHRSPAVEPRLASALDTLNGWMPGFPSSAAGFAEHGRTTSCEHTEPCDCDVALTGVESLATGLPDTAVGMLRELTVKARRMARDASAVERIVDRLRVEKRTAAADMALPDDWCTSCYRDDQRFEPVTLRPDGAPYYKGLCRWCGRFRAEHGRLPTDSIIKHHHTRGHLTVAMLEREGFQKAA